MMDTEGRLSVALAQYERRQDRAEHPHGDFDRQGRWFPSAEETCSCCRSIRGPSRAHPYSMMLHCRSVEHVAQLHSVDAADLRSAYRHKRPARRLGGTYYKAVAVADDGRLVSIYDGTTEYHPGKLMRQAVRREHNGGYYVYDSQAAARNASVPRDSALADAPRAVLTVEVTGQYTRYPCVCQDCREARHYGEGPLHPIKYAFSTITVVAVEMPATTVVAD